MTYFNETGQLPADAIEKEIFGEIEQVSPSQKAREARLKDFNYENEETIPKETKPSKKEREKITFASLQKFKITPEKIQEYTPEWLVDGFLVKRTLVNIYARGGAGKSYFVLNLCKWLLEKDKVKRILYIDGDNGLGVFSRRKLDITLMDEPYKSRLVYISGLVRSQDGEYLDKRHLISDLACDVDNYAGKLDDTLIVIDSIRDFIGGDMAKDNIVIPVLDDLKKLRENGATIIFLHHQPKQPSNPDENNQAYKGATAFSDSVDEAWYFANRTKDEHGGNKLVVTLEPQKRRDDTKHQAFVVDLSDAAMENLTQADYWDYALNDKQQAALDYALEVIAENPQGIIQGKLASAIYARAKEDEREVVGKNLLWELLKKYDKALFNIRKEPGKNRSIYEPLAGAQKSNEYGAAEIVEFKE